MYVPVSRVTDLPTTSDNAYILTTMKLFQIFAKNSLLCAFYIPINWDKYQCLDSKSTF